MEQIINQIIEYADNDSEYGWLTVEHEGHIFHFPKRAAIIATLGKTRALRHFLPEYTPFASSGWKLPLDEPAHTDALLGAGIDVDDAYNRKHPAYEAWFKAAMMIEDQYRDQFNFDFIVLSSTMDIDKARITARVYNHQPLEDGVWSSNNIHCADPPKNDWNDRRAIVIPHGGIEYDLPARHADVIITEAGGKLCHLATVAREYGKLMIRLDGAVDKFPPFSKVSINLDTLKIKPNF